LFRHWFAFTDAFQLTHFFYFFLRKTFGSLRYERAQKMAEEQHGSSFYMFLTVFHSLSLLSQSQDPLAAKHPSHGTLYLSTYVKNQPYPHSNQHSKHSSFHNSFIAVTPPPASPFPQNTSHTAPPPHSSPYFVCVGVRASSNLSTVF
jgi:hypothetical protein